MVCLRSRVQKNLQQSDNVISFEDKMTSAQRNKARRKQDRSLERGRYAKAAAKKQANQPVTSTGRVCAKIAKYVPEPLLGTQWAQAQFFARKTLEPFN